MIYECKTSPNKNEHNVRAPVNKADNKKVGQALQFTMNKVHGWIVFSVAAILTILSKVC